MTNFNGHEVELPEGAMLIESARAYDFVSYSGWTIYSLEDPDEFPGRFIIEEDSTGEMVGPFTFNGACRRIEAHRPGRVIEGMMAF